MNWTAVAVGLIPSIGVGLLFWFAMRAVIRADRNERAALAREDEAHAARQAAAEADTAVEPASRDDATASPGDDGSPQR